MSSQVCVDASLVLKLVLAEEDSPLVHELWDRCELWTGDRRLYHAVKDGLPWVRGLDDYQRA